MMLSHLLSRVPYDSISPQGFEMEVKTIGIDSREDMPQGLFVAMPGVNRDGEAFIGEAIRQGARVIVKKDSSRLITQGIIPAEVAVVACHDPKGFLSAALKVFYGDPSSSVRMIAVTGTNGKTTVTYVLEAILLAAGLQSGVIGTVNHRIAGETFPSKNTTPSLVDNQKYLASLARMNIPYGVMETSSHALHQGRLDGIHFRSAIFTNLTQDHLDYHHSMEEYFSAKARLFEDLPATSSAIINVDDPYGSRLLKITQAKVMTYGIDALADVRAFDIQYALTGTRFRVSFPHGEARVQTRFIGKHNVYNLLGAIACALAEGLSIASMLEGINRLVRVPGRLEPVDAGQDFFVFIDYAHTEDGLVNVLKGLRAVSDKRIIVVYGCGGDRDKTKRPKMGRAVSELADYALVTSDNPRSEDPLAIIQDIIAGCPRSNYEVCVDRKKAIARALTVAQSGDIVLLAGKGHETYQILHDQTVPFDEHAIVTELLASCLLRKKS